MGSSKALVFFLGLGPWIGQATACTGDFDCSGVNVCDGGNCVAPAECDSDAIQLINDVVEIGGSRCKVTLEQLHTESSNVVTKDGTEYTLNNKIVLSDGAILEIHGASHASDNKTAVSLLKLKSDNESSAPIVAQHGKISILNTTITSWDASVGGPDVRVQEDHRAYIAALSSENSSTGDLYISRMDVEASEISYLGNEGDYHNDTDSDYGLVWKVLGYDDRSPDVNSGIFDKVGVYGSLKNNNLHDNYIGAYCYGMKGNSVWDSNEVHNNTLNGLNLQDNSDDMTVSNNHVHDNGWHGIEISKRCARAMVENNLVEDNDRAGIFFHRSSDYAVARNNRCYRNLGGNIGIFECTGCEIHNNYLEGGKYGVRFSVGAQENEVHDNNIVQSTSYGVFFYRGSDDAEASIDYDGRPRNNTISDNEISRAGEDGKAVAVKGSDNNIIINNIFTGTGATETGNIVILRFEDSTETLVVGNIFNHGLKYIFEDNSTLAGGSQEPTQ